MKPEYRQSSIRYLISNIDLPGKLVAYGKRDRKTPWAKDALAQEGHSRILRGSNHRLCRVSNCQYDFISADINCAG